jgi:hypothetical protein
MVSMFTPGVLFLTVVIFLVVCMGIGLFLGTLTFVWGDVVTIPEKRGK